MIRESDILQLGFEKFTQYGHGIEREEFSLKVSDTFVRLHFKENNSIDFRLLKKEGNLLKEIESSTFSYIRPLLSKLKTLKG